MEHWEFLIQKEGDRAWLPLESPTVEVLEGRYRVIARSQDINTTVKIEIVHQYEVDGLTKKLVQQQSQQLNDEGLMAIMPFTYLHPGLWQISCSSTDSTATATSWQRVMQLQVLLQEASEDWELIYNPVFSPQAVNVPEDSSESQPINALLTTTPISLSETTLTNFTETEVPAYPSIEMEDTIPAVPDLAVIAAAEVEPETERVLTGAGSGKPRSPELPRFMYAAEPLHLRPITGPTLPPQIYPSYHRDIQEPQLPAFAASPPILAAYFQESALTTRIEAELNRSPVEMAFAALHLRQRFWSTLNILAQDTEPLPDLESLLEALTPSEEESHQDQ